MKVHTLGSSARWLLATVGAAAAAYAAYVSVTWYRYGDAKRPTPDEQDPLLDRFMPAYEVVERHRIRVSATPAFTLAAAREQDIQTPIARAIFRAREMLLGATPPDRSPSGGLLAQVLALGWGVLAEVEDRETVVGAVTKPWEADVIFRALPPGEFAAFAEPGYVKIVWTLRADPVGWHESIFRTETRAAATDAAARAKFRRYWAFFSPGISLIRWASLRPMKADAERRAAAQRPTAGGGRFAPSRPRVSAGQVTHAELDVQEVAGTVQM
jgi:hypothetical protein